MLEAVTDLGNAITDFMIQRRTEFAEKAVLRTEDALSRLFLNEADAVRLRKKLTLQIRNFSLVKVVCLLDKVNDLNHELPAIETAESAQSWIDTVRKHTQNLPCPIEASEHCRSIVPAFYVPKDKEKQLRWAIAKTGYAHNTFYFPFTAGAWCPFEPDRDLDPSKPIEIRDFGLVIARKETDEDGDPVIRIYTW